MAGIRVRYHQLLKNVLGNREEAIVGRVKGKLPNCAAKTLENIFCTYTIFGTSKSRQIFQEKL